MFCEKCGNQMPDDSRFCLNCGAQNEVTQPVQDVEQEAGASVDATPAAISEAATDAQSTVEQQPAPRTQPAPQMGNVPPAGQAYQQPVPPTQQYVVEPKPEKISPLPTWKFIGMFILTGIPIIGLVMILVWSFSSSFNRNTKSFARAILILRIIGLVLSIVGVIMYWSILKEFVDYFGSLGMPFNY